MKLNSNYYILRHGQSLANVKEIHSSWPEKFYSPLTLKGRKEAERAAQKLKDKNIDLIFSSDLLRTKQTAGIVSKKLGLKVSYDKRLREIDIGIFNGKTLDEFRKLFPSEDVSKRFKIKPKGGETYSQVKKRMSEFFKEINKRYPKRNILIISHEGPLTLLEAKIRRIPNREVFKKFPKDKRIKTGELRQLK